MITEIKREDHCVVEHATEWEWAVQKYVAKRYRFVKTEGVGMMLRIVRFGDHPNRDEYDCLAKAGITLGADEQIEWLYNEAKFNMMELTRDIDLSEDGVIDFTDRRKYLVANARFHNAVLSVNRFVLQTEVVLKKAMGENSDAMRSWLDSKKRLEDDSLSFGFCLEERNHIEHTMKPLSLMNDHPITHRGGLAVNLESDYMHYDKRKMKRSYQRLREDFMRERKAEGKRPLLSIASMVRGIQFATILLYMTAKSAILEAQDDYLPAARAFEAESGFNGLLMEPRGDDTETYRQPRRVLHWKSESLQDVARKRLESCDEALRRLTEQMDDPGFTLPTFFML